MVWYMALPAWHMRWLHSTVLELLACAFNAIIFGRLVPPHARLLLQTDSVTAYYTLVDESERSTILVHAHHLVLADGEFDAIKDRLDLGHLGGDGNRPMISSIVLKRCILIIHHHGHDQSLESLVSHIAASAATRGVAWTRTIAIMHVN